MIKGVIFDLGGTLLRFEGVWHDVLARGRAALAAHLRAGGLDLDEAAFVTRYDQYLNEFYTQREHDWAEYTAAHILRLCLAEMGITDVSNALVDEGLVTMFGHSERLWRPFDDAQSTLERLRVAGYRLGLISNASDDANVQRLIDLGGFRRYFDPIVVSAAVGVRKPSPRIFEIVLDRWQLPPEQVAMVGDTLGADILGADLTGLRSVWATMDADNAANAAHRDHITPDATITALSELPDVLARWNGSLFP
jgi:putative hydrolase of the HAD superfamily